VNLAQPKSRQLLWHLPYAAEERQSAALAPLSSPFSWSPLGCLTLIMSYFCAGIFLVALTTPIFTSQTRVEQTNFLPGNHFSVTTPTTTSFNPLHHPQPTDLPQGNGN